MLDTEYDHYEKEHAAHLWLVKVHRFLYTRAQIDAAYRLEAR